MCEENQSEARETDGIDPFAPEVVCGHCMRGNSRFADFCHNCGMPLSSFATIDPWKHIFTLGWYYRRLVTGRIHPVVFWGTWAVFGLPFAVGLSVLTFLLILAAMEPAKPAALTLPQRIHELPVGSAESFSVRVPGTAMTPQRQEPDPSPGADAPGSIVMFIMAALLQLVIFAGYCVLMYRMTKWYRRYRGERRPAPQLE